MKKIFIDGSAGTTGLRIVERLESRDDIELIKLSDDKRKDIEARREAINSADIAFLCLPDAAAIEAVSLIDNDKTVVLDTSTAHRTNSDWAYGFPELSVAHEEKIKNSKRIAVPGCHASGFISLIYPLVEKGIINKDILLSCFSLTGYSGGGK
ncbi:MAG: N-acetyl-gamma-glutamyl-phosphate reductase, partial [Clostridia bacterium]|nr:N-acetyl-gamma-glutamyl-phosphate reductase [Clostridia bacterium]